jgi:hypothetical protein
VRPIFLAAAISLAAASSCQRGPGEAPKGQPKVLTLSAANLDEVRATFNASRASPRVVGLFSTT